MKSLRVLLLLSVLLIQASASCAEPLRVFIRAGEKTHGPGAHDHPRFLSEWTKLLNERGANADGSLQFPTKEQLDNTDVLILHAERAGNIKIGEERKNLNEFLKRGGGLVVIHAGAVSDDSEYYKNLIGGSWKNGTTKWLEGPMSLYFTDHANPITKEASNFDLDDEIYYDMDVQPDVKVLAAAYTPKPLGRDAKAQDRAKLLTDGGKKVSVYDVQPQMWTYERTIEGGAPYRSFVSIPGHYYAHFELPNYRAILLRGIAWAGKLNNIDTFCAKSELTDLRYPAGGPTSPEKAAQKLEVHPEFDLSLVASEPLINKVLNLDWDEKGRLWVCETPEYPNGRRIVVNTDTWKDSGTLDKGLYDRDPEDRISILTDTNGDGVMDKKHVFADKLELVTSFVFYKKGVIACSAPDVWLLEDSDGDEVADKRTKLYTGLGQNDTHAVINNLRWGTDGWIYATVGYSAGHPTSPDGSVDFGSITAGVVRFKPDGSAFEQFSSKNSNTWGLTMTSDGQCFFTQPTCGDVLMHVVLPEYVLAKGKLPGTNSYNVLMKGEKTFPLMKWEQQAYVQIDQVGSFTAASGCAIYEGGAWPDKWNYSYFTGEPTINIVSHRFVTPEGVTYKAEKEKGREDTEFIRSHDMWFRPVEERIGPDGALYVIDFYNQAVIHNDTRGPLHGPANAAVRPDRDHYFGRIWKIQHKQAKKLEVPVLDKKDLDGLITAATKSPNAHVRGNAWRILRTEYTPAEIAKSKTEGAANVMAQWSGLVSDSTKQTSPVTFFQLSEKTDQQATRNKLLDAFISAQDVWSRSAIIAAAYLHPTEFIESALIHHQPAELAPFVEAVTPTAISQSADNAVKLIISSANAPAAADNLKFLVLQGVNSKASEVSTLTPEVTAALKKLLTEPATANATLPVAVKWDKGGVLRDVLATQIAALTTQLSDTKKSTQERTQVAQSLLSARTFSPEILPNVATVLADENNALDFQQALIAALGNTDDLAAGEAIIAAYERLKPQLQTIAFDQLIKRPAWTEKLLSAVKDGKMKASSLGPANIARLRTYPDKRISKLANTMLDQLISPASKEKTKVIATLTPEIIKPGDAAKGHVIFSAACSICHQFGNEGKLIGPILTGMGAHGPADLLGHIVDPNREVDPSFWTWNIVKKNGEALAGIIAQENQATVLLRNQSGEFEIRKDEIATRENTQRSLMPEGFEALGAENLRDLLTYICGSETRFRIVDLKNAYTADSRHGLFASEEAGNDTVHFAKFGNVIVESIPFFLMDPIKSLTGANLIVLKGGGGKAVAQSHPQSIEFPVNVEAKTLHLLSGIAGWGHPAIPDERVALKVTVTFADGQTEVTELLNGVHFADYNREIEVPESRLTKGLVTKGQLRLISLNVKKSGVISKVTLESLDNGISPVVVAITTDANPFVTSEQPAPTASKPEKKEAANEMPAPEKIVWEKGKIKALIVAGGTSHEFRKWFEEADSTFLKAAGYSVNFTENSAQAAEEIKNVDVVIVSVNRPFFDTVAWRKALFDHVATGKGVIMLHPGTWYGYSGWPELNAKIVGGGSRGHDKLGEYSVNVLKKDHPILKGVPANFSVVDELYYMNAEAIPEGTASIEIIAETSPSQKYGKPHPSIWITQNDKARMVGIALGHDQRVHDLPAFQTLLINAVKWSSQK